MLWSLGESFFPFSGLFYFVGLMRLGSGDGTLSVIDIKSSKQTPFAQSEDQEDELLSVVSIRG